MLAKVTHDLTVRLDEENGQLLFFASRRTTSAKDSQKEAIPFSVEILLSDLKGKNIADAERLIGSSVLSLIISLQAA